MPSPESIAAKEAAEASLQQAEADLAQAQRNVKESRPLIEKIKRHNEANHYDQWIEDLLRLE